MDKNGGEIVEYPFPAKPSETGYCVFPEELEDDDLVFFHATPNFPKILSEGLRLPTDSGEGNLPSLTFTKRSVSALHHAMERRKTDPRPYRILVLRYESVDRKGIAEEVSMIHDHTLEPPPKLVGFCKIPETYRHF